MDQQLGRGGSRERVLASVRVMSAVLIAIAIGGIVLAVSSILWISSAVTVRIPVQPFWPQLLEGTVVTDGPPAYVAGGGFTYADVEVADADWDVRLWTAAGWTVQSAAAAALGFAAFRVAEASGAAVFSVRLRSAIRFAGLVLVLGGIAWQVCFSLAGSAAAEQVLSYSGWYGTAEPQLNGPLGVAPDPGVMIEFTPILWGLSLLLISAALAFARRHRGSGDGWRRPS